MYEKHWIQEHPYTDDEIRAMVAPDMTLDKLRAIIADYNIESRLKAKVKAGVMQQSELDAVLKK
jgi:hypothetical protein